MPITLYCPRCQGRFQVPPSHAGKRTHCSRACFVGRTLRERFFDKVDKMPGGCWLWTASLTTKGYGSFSLDGRPAEAHRVSWLLEHGHLPERPDQVNHTCDVPRCVRPSHLWVGTQAENMADAARKGRMRGRVR